VHEPSALATKLTSQERVDEQIVRSSIEWHDNHLRVGRQHVQLFSLVDSPAASRANLLGALQSMDANLIFCSCWAPRRRNAVQKRIGQAEGFSGIFRHTIVALAANLKKPGEPGEVSRIEGRREEHGQAGRNSEFD
jgi:hypothetical protein